MFQEGQQETQSRKGPNVSGKQERISRRKARGPCGKHTYLTAKTTERKVAIRPHYIPEAQARESAGPERKTPGKPVRSRQSIPNPARHRKEQQRSQSPGTRRAQMDHESPSILLAAAQSAPGVWSLRATSMRLRDTPRCREGGRQSTSKSTTHMSKSEWKELRTQAPTPRSHTP